MLSVTLPVELFHQHDESESCTHSHNHEKLDLCHVSICHQHDLVEPHCDHDAHFSDRGDGDNTCELLTVQLLKTPDGMDTGAKARVYSNPLPEYTTPGVQLDILLSLRGRAPPKA